MSIKQILFMLFMVNNICFGHFFRAEKYSLHNPSLAKKQHIYLFSDFHISDDQNNRDAILIHQQDIITLAKQIQAHVIVEDGMVTNRDEIVNSSSVSIQQKHLPTQERYLKYLKKIETPLGALASGCYLQSVSCSNVEFRFTPIRPLDIYCKFLNNKKTQIRSEYKDDATFESYYALKLNELEQIIEIPCKALFDIFKNSHCTIEEYLAQENNIPIIETIDEIISQINDEKWDLDNISYKEKIRKLFTTYCATFLDIQALHEIARHPNQENIIICAGDFHIECIKTALKKIGYIFEGEYGSHFELYDGTKYNEPEAINVHEAYTHLTTIQNNSSTLLALAISFINTFKALFPFVLINW